MNEKIVCLLGCCLLLSGCQQPDLAVVYPTTTHATAVRTDTSSTTERVPAVTSVFIFHEDMPGPHKFIERGGRVDLVEPTLAPKPTKIPTEEPVPVSSPELPFAARERKLFEQVVSAEAGPTWGYKGCLLLAQTTVNQWQDGSWGKSLSAVLKHPGNYSVYANGRYLKVPISDNAVKAVEAALSGKSGISKKILYYCTESQYKKKGFHYRQKWIITYENVMFFGKKG